MLVLAIMQAAVKILWNGCSEFKPSSIMFVLRAPISYVSFPFSSKYGFRTKHYCNAWKKPVSVCTEFCHFLWEHYRTGADDSWRLVDNSQGLSIHSWNRKSTTVDMYSSTALSDRNTSSAMLCTNGIGMLFRCAVGCCSAAVMKIRSEFAKNIYEPFELCGAPARQYSCRIICYRIRWCFKRIGSTSWL